MIDAHRGSVRMKPKPLPCLTAAVGPRALVAALAFSVPAAELAAEDIDLATLGGRGFQIIGEAPGDTLGISVSGAGDINGDGHADLIIGARGADRPGGDSHGASYVVFGKASTSTVNITSLGAGGFRVDGIDSVDLSGASVSSAGDVNGDGLADIVIGAPGADRGPVLNAGEAYVVFGKADSAPVALGALGTKGFLILGAAAGDRLGTSVSGAGDVNGDGLDDLIVTASWASPGGNAQAGTTYVVFGKAGSEPVDVANLGEAGFRIDGAAIEDRSGESAAGAGDINGDGLADIIVGAFLADVNGVTDAGTAYVVFGKTDTAPVAVASLGSGGFPINGIAPNDRVGAEVSGAGDVNGDGLADVIIGAHGADPLGREGAGAAYVVFGKSTTSPVNLSSLGNAGFPIYGAAMFNLTGPGVSGAGDVNGDGLADLTVGAFRASPLDRTRAGEAYVVFGKSTATAVDLASLGDAGIRFFGPSEDDDAGASSSGAGDVDGDGLADVVIGAPDAGPVNAEPGISYVVFSKLTSANSRTTSVRSRNGDPPRLAIGISGDRSNADTPDARAWIDFAGGMDAVNAASTEIVTVTRSALAFGAPAANVAWRVQTTRTGWSSAEVRLRWLESELLFDEQSLTLYFSPDNVSPYRPLDTIINPLDNTATAIITEPGYLVLGRRDAMFGNGFESNDP